MTQSIQGSSVPVSIQQDVWHYHALGKRAETVYSYILDYDQVKIDEVVDRSNIGRLIVKRAVDILFKNGLVEDLGDGIYKGIVMTEKKAIEIAKNHGTDGSSKKRIDYHQNEREIRVSQILLKEKHIWIKKHG